MLTAAKQILLSGTSTGIRALTLANVITDATRRAAVEGDGLSVPGGYGVWPAATNKNTNSGLETNTTGYIDGSGSNVIARVASGSGGVTSLFGAAMGRGTHGAADSGEWWRYPITLSASTTYTASCYLWIPTAYTGTSVPALNITDFTGATGTLTTDFSLALRDQWQRATVTFTTDVDTTGTLRVIPTVAAVDAGNITYVDGVQVETGSVATPVVPTDGGEATRSAGRVQVAVEGLFTPTQGAIVARLRTGWANGAATGNPRVYDWFVDTDNRILIIYNTGANLWQMTRVAAASGNSASVAGGAFSVGADATVFGKWSATSLGISLAGGTFTTAADTNIPNLTGAASDFGSENGAGDFLSGNLRWAITFKGTPTDADAALPWMTQNAVPTLSQIAQLSAASKPTLLIPADTSAARLLPAYFGGTL